MNRRRGLMGASGGRLPAGYQEVEWISSQPAGGARSAPYIDTGIIPQNNFGVFVTAWEKFNIVNI